MNDFLTINFNPETQKTFSSFSTKEFSNTNIIHYSDTESFINHVRKKKTDLIFIEFNGNSDNTSEIINKLKDGKTTKGIPIVIIYDPKQPITYSNAQDETTVLYLAKPIKEIELIPLIKTLLKISILRKPSDEDKRVDKVSYKTPSSPLSPPSLSNLIHNLNGFIYRCRIDKNWTMEYLSDTILDITGFPASDFINNEVRTYNSIIHPQDKKRIWDEIQAAFNKQDYFVIEYRIITSTGETSWVWEKGIKVKAGEKNLIEGFVEDITEKKNIEIALRENEENLKTTLYSIGDAVITTDVNGNITRMNPVAESLTEWKAEDAYGKALEDVFKIYNSITNKIAESPVKKVIKTGQIVGLANHTKLISKNGTEYQISDSGSPILDRQNKVSGVILVFRDVTKEYDIKEKINESEKQLKKAQKIGRTGSWLFDLNTGKTIVSDESYRIYGINPDSEYKISDLQKIPLPEYRNMLDSALEKLIKYNKKYDIEFKIKRPSDGEIIDIHSLAEYNSNDNTVTGIIQDITKQKHADLVLKESEEKFRSVFHSANDAIIITNSEGVILDWNTAANNIFGYAKNEVLDKDIFMLIPKHLKNKHISWSEWFTKQKKSPIDISTIEFYGKHKNGSLIPLELSLSKWDTENNIYFAAIIRDITIRKKAEEKLVESENRLNKAEQLAGFGNWLWDLKTNQIIWSKNMFRIFGVKQGKKNTVSLEFYQKFVPEKELKDMWSVAEKTFIEKRELSYELPVTVKNKTKVLQSLLCPIFDSKGMPKALFGISVDITEKKTVENQLKLLSRSVEQSPVSIVITDKNGNIEYVNKSFTRITGYTFNEALGQNPRILKSGYQPDSIYKELWNTIVAKKDWSGELQNKTKNGDIIWEEVNISAITDRSGEITHFVAIKENITKRKEIISELILAKEKAEESDRLKSAFLANMSHEIRTPMNGILGFSELLTDPHLSGEESQEYIRIIQESGNRMLTTINDLMDLSKIEAGMINLKIETVNIHNLLLEQSRFFKPEAGAKKLLLSYKPDLLFTNFSIETDKEKLNAIFTNLIKNAIKYTFKGFVEFGYHARHDHLLFYVKDSGIGIKDNVKDAIFDRFVQAESGYRKTFEGTGLGLSITKAYVKMLDGEIWVESSPDKGSEFFVRLPIKNRKN
ncbi:PAS domain S-box protein [Saccharicrinis sp. FJH2]|uniref:PAS domain S-box protein n=1 Tax=Saccharicrinis sp. FJH65 TaxID=3344659 RepID=UPI0035F4B56F